MEAKLKERRCINVQVNFDLFHENIPMTRKNRSQKYRCCFLAQKNTVKGAQTKKVEENAYGIQPGKLMTHMCRSKTKLCDQNYGRTKA